MTKTFGLSMRKAGLFFTLFILAIQAGACGESREELAAGNDEPLSSAMAEREAARAIEKAIEESSRGQIRVDISAEGLEIQGQKAGKDYSFAAGGKVAVPPDFPPDVPLYPAAAVRMAQILEDGYLTVILGTADPLERPLLFYREQPLSAGWKALNEARLDDEQFMYFERRGEKLTVGISPEEKETVISLTYMKADEEEE